MGLTFLQNTQIECIDAVQLIRTRDSAETLFYCDPPYFNANMGHYDGYTAEDFELLLKTLAKIEGKFILSSYPSDMLTQYLSQNKWQSIEIAGIVRTGARIGNTKRKTEVLTANYPLNGI
ncbi:hypothetical protein AGMMS4956_21420 [Bacteroidia bacterium]|nr:hypothetical protein AGMMS4956_21420 [Bacteroidia bacterium]